MNKKQTHTRTHTIEYKREDARFYNRTFADNNQNFKETMGELLKDGYYIFRIWEYKKYKEIHNIQN